jgi:uncharacterized protein (TIGR03083 family)
MDTMAMATQERAEFTALLETLTPQQWEAPSLCAGWSVRDVVAHAISYEELGPREVLNRLSRGMFVPARANAIGLDNYRTLGPDELVALYRRCARPSGLTASFGGRIALCDGMVHQQDVRRPLGLPREIPAERIAPVLTFAMWAPLIRGALRTRGVRLVATDVDWSFGAGPEARGPAESLLMVMTGRHGIVPELSGPGTEKLAARIDG